MRPERNSRRMLAGLLLALCLPAQGADVPLKAFRATYSATLNGVPLGFPVTVDLNSSDSDTWAMALTASSGVLDYREHSRFRWHNCNSTPLQYRYDFQGFGISRKLWLDFDHDKRRAIGESRKGALDYAFPADATDELSLTFAARCQLARGAGEARFNAATINGMKKLVYRNDGTESVKTPLGTFEALRIQRVRKEGDKRRSTVWVAPKLDYLMVKMEHVEKLGVRGTILLRALDTPPATAASAASGIRP